MHVNSGSLGQTCVLTSAKTGHDSTNTLGKGMNPTIIPPTMGRLGSLTFVWYLVKEKENS